MAETRRRVENSDPNGSTGDDSGIANPIGLLPPDCALSSTALRIEHVIVRRTQLRGQSNPERAFLSVTKDKRASGGFKNKLTIDGPRALVPGEGVRLRLFGDSPLIRIEQTEPGSQRCAILTLRLFFHALQQHVTICLMRMVAVDGPWAEKLAPVAKSRAIIGTLDDYYAWASPRARMIDLWQTTYVHPLDGIDAIVDWFSGSALRPFLDKLDVSERPAFLDKYRQELEMAYLPQSDGKVLLFYPRLFLVAQR